MRLGALLLVTTSAGAIASIGCGRVGYELLASGGAPANGAGAAGGIATAPDAAAGGAAGSSLDGSSAGAAASGGAPVYVEASAGGGTTASGGTAAQGDASAGGGTTASGGTAAQGDASASGGTSATDAARASGGTTASGGADAGCTLVPLTLPDWCTQIPALAATPVIDGRLDCPLALHALPPLGWTTTGTPDVTADYAIAWSSTGIYFYVVVHDPLVVPAAAADPAWMGDAVELYVDQDGVYPSAPAFDATGTRQFVVAAPSGAGSSARGVVYVKGAGANAPWASTQFGAFPAADGYVVEAYVTAVDIALSQWTPAAGAHVGFDVAIDVSYPTAAQTGAEGHRLGQYFLHLAPTNGPPYSDVAAFCGPTLVPR